MNEPSTVENISGNLITGITATSVAALGVSITPLAAFVPFLLQSLATGRQAKRIDKSLAEINEILVAHKKAIENISDFQYKLICEVISAVFQSVNQEKIEFLKAAVKNTLTTNVVNDKNTDYLSRILRDISVEEAHFIIDNFQYKNIFFGKVSSVSDGRLTIKEGSETEIIASGLINMGLIYSKIPTLGSTKYTFSPVVAKLLVLLGKYR